MKLRPYPDRTDTLRTERFWTFDGDSSMNPEDSEEAQSTKDASFDVPPLQIEKIDDEIPELEVSPRSFVPSNLPSSPEGRAPHPSLVQVSAPAINNEWARSKRFSDGKISLSAMPPVVSSIIFEDEADSATTIAPKKNERVLGDLSFQELLLEIKKLENKDIVPVGGSEFNKFLSWVSRSWMFSSFIMLIIILNVIVIAVETDKTLSRDYGTLLSAANTIFLTVYTMEFAIKVYVEPLGYWRSGFNVFDFMILVFAYFNVAIVIFSNAQVTALLFGSASSSITVTQTFRNLRILRALRALRALRSVNYVQDLQLLVTALFKTIQSALNILLLMVIVMYVFAITFYYLYGTENTPAQSTWGTLQGNMLNLFVISTLDGWTGFQEELNESGYRNMVWLTILYIFVGHFIFTNLFIGVIISNLDEATELEKKEQQLLARMRYLQKTQWVVERQEMALEKLVAKKKLRDPNQDVDLNQMLREAAGKMLHSDLTPMKYSFTSPWYVETYNEVLFYTQSAMHRMQHVAFELCETLAEIAEHQAQEQRLALDSGGYECSSLSPRLLVDDGGDDKDLEESEESEDGDSDKEGTNSNFSQQRSNPRVQRTVSSRV
jgi:cation channel sperm-associated protein 3